MDRSTGSWLVVLAVCMASATARAGVCTTEAEADQDMGMIEVFAGDAHKPPPADSFAWMCVRLQAPRLAVRVISACGQILDRDGDRGECIDLVAVLGMARVGKHDIFHIVSQRPLEPFDSIKGPNYNLYLLGAIGDARAAPIIIRAWQDMEPRIGRHHGRAPDVLPEWAAWRQIAAQILGRIANTGEVRAFLDAQGASADDHYVKQACIEASRAIAQRGQPR